MPSWLMASPWVIVACALLLAALVFLLSLQRGRKEGDISAALYLERGASLIYAYEATLHTGLGFGWKDEELQDVLDSMATAPDIYYMAVADQQGLVLAASVPGLLDTQLLSPEDMEMLQPARRPQTWVGRAQTVGPDHDPTDIFMVYKIISDERYRERFLEHGHNMMMRHQGRMMGRGYSPIPERQNLVVFVGYDFSPILAARAIDERQTLVNSVILAFLTLAGALSLFLVKSYQRSRKLVQETTAFSFALIDTLPLGIIGVDEKGSITTFNPQAERITGLAGQDMLDRDMKDALPSLWDALNTQELLSRRAPTQERELRCLFGQTRRIPLAVSVAPIVTDDGEAKGHTVILRDLAEIRHLQAEIRRQDRLAALGSMAAGVAHEIRNPLGAIKGLARFFQEISPPDSEEARVSGVMTQEVLRLDKVVGDLLELSRPDVLNLTPVDLCAFFGRIRDMIRDEMQAARIEFSLDLPDPCPAIVMDYDRMTQVFLNLFLNAIQAMPQGGRLKLRAFYAGDGGQSTENPADYRRMILEVSDTGQGIAPDHLGSIFQPYFTTKAQGTGLGLSLVQKIVEAHDGEINAAANPGRGSTFTLRLPLPLRGEEKGTNDV